MGLLDFLNPVHDIVALVNDVIGKFVPDPAQKLALQAQVLAAQTALAERAMDLQSQVVDAQSKIITAEATSSSWLEKDWRPIMLLFFGIVVGFAIFNGGYDLAGHQIPTSYVDSALTIVKIGIGGYIMTPVVQALKSNGTTSK